MPNINNIPDSFYQGMQPYHVEFDNLPIKSLLNKLNVVNGAVDNNSKILREAAGNQGTLSNRLNQSINDDGNLKPSAIDEAKHNIGCHIDGAFDDGEGLVDYVRMKKEERDKLESVSPEANVLTVKVETISSTIVFDDAELVLRGSDQIQLLFEEPNVVTFVTTFPTNQLVSHNYDLEPVPSNLHNTNYIDYRVTSMSTPYVEGSLKVYVNGIRLSSEEEVYVPPADGSHNWKLTSFTPDHENGTFAMSRALTAADVLRIDFDCSYI